MSAADRIYVRWTAWLTGVSESLTYADAVRVAERYVGAYNDRDLDAILAVQAEDVVSYPAPLYGHRPQPDLANLPTTTSYHAPLAAAAAHHSRTPA